MLRTSEISSPSEFTIEHQREDLRDRRWERHRDMAWTVALVIRIAFPALALGILGIAHLLGWL
jgi:hypothetical protein